MRSDGVLGATTDASAAGWIAESIGAFTDHAVGSLVPPVFEAYARILHPAWVDTQFDLAPIPWATVAAWSGGTVHALAQFEPMARARRHPSSPAPFTREPETGELGTATLANLCALLAGHTTTAGACYFGLWEGHGWLTDAARRTTAHFELPERHYLLYEGPLTGFADIGWRWGEGLAEALGSRTTLETLPGEFEPQSPNLTWPSDRRWLVATEIDLDSTYIGGSTKLVEEIVSDPRFEAWIVESTDQVTGDSDRINGVV